MLLDQVSIHAFIQNNGIKTETGKPLDFKTHRYLFDIYRDNSKYLVCLKAGQIGFSTMAILKTIWLAKNRKLNIGYILPTVEMVQKFVGSKVNPIAQQNPVIQQWMKDKDSIMQKQIGGNFIHYLGSQTDLSAIMLSLDMLIGDEFDKSPQTILETYDSRLQHSDYGWKWVFSNPTIPDYGVDRYWAMSDKKMWHVTHYNRGKENPFVNIDQLAVAGCTKEFVLDESCIDYTARAYICSHCKGTITDEDRRMGEWKATAQGDWSGYWIPLWVNPMIPASKVVEYKKTKTKEYFANFVAGLPYVNPNDALSQQALVRCLSKDVNEQEGRTIIGLDTGHNLHYTLMNKQGVYYHGYCKSVDENLAAGGKASYDPYDEIDLLLAKNPQWILVSDQGGDLIGIRKLKAKYPGRVFLCWFTKETKNQTLIRWGENDEYGKVLVDRERTVQLAVDQINEGRIAFNGTLEDWQPFFDHALNIYRVKEILGDENDPQYGWRWKWRRKGADHWFMAMIYGLVGMDRFSQDLATFIKKDNFMEGVSTGSDEHGFISARQFGVPVSFE